MIADNLLHIRQHITTIANRCGRNPEKIRLVAVSKTFPVSAIREAAAADQLLFGENYIQEAENKFKEVGDQVHLHFIGHLQSNKAHIAAGIFQMIQTVDRFKLALSLNRHLLQAGRTMDILIQVNIGRDANKSGITPEDTEDLLKKITPLSNLRVRGLMTIPPFFEDPERSRPSYRGLRQLGEDLLSKNLFFDNTSVELSMGMSHDYPIAIEEGATLLRIGTAVFGGRP